MTLADGPTRRHRMECHSGRYVVAQIAGAIGGVLVAHADVREAVSLAFRGEVRAGGSARWFSEAVATFGFILVIRWCSRKGA